MTLSEELTWRGFVNQTTYKDIKVLDDKTLTFYWGVDPSADSMQVGNFAIAMMVRHFIDHGHKAILLVGGATGQIGDPDGKDAERDLKSLEEVKRNKEAISRQYETVFEGQQFELVDNYDWFKDIGYLDFLREVGKYFSMTQLLDRDFVQSRIGQGGAGISYAEFSYSLIQGYDFLHLHRKKGATLQVSGADQWGNSISGVEMIRKLEGKEAHVWTAPMIVNKSTGKKFGKSEDGAVWLDEKKTSVFKFYQFWLNTGDADVADYLKIFTLLSPEEVTRLKETITADPGGRLAQKTLAYEVTKIVHGEVRADQARSATQVLFGSDKLKEGDIDMLSQELTTASPGKVVDILVVTGVANGNSEARRLIEGGGISVNGEKITSDQEVSAPGLIKKGKNSFLLVK